MQVLATADLLKLVPDVQEAKRLLEMCSAAFAPEMHTPLVRELFLFVFILFDFAVTQDACACE